MQALVDPQGRGAPSRLACALAAAGVLVAAAAVSLLRIRDFDYWWHLRTGQWIAEHGEVPRSDPYTYTVFGERWIDVHWLFQLGLYQLEARFGHGGVVVAKLALVLAVLALLAPIGARRGRPFVSALALGLMLLACCERILPRPELASLVLLAALLFVLDRAERSGAAWLAGVPLIQGIWANIHSLFAVGLGVVALHGIGAVLDGAAGRPVPRGRRLALAAAFAAGVAASLANPNGLDTLLYPLRQLGMIGPSGLRAAIGLQSAELASLVSAWPTQPAILRAAFCALLLGSAAALVADARRVRAGEALGWLALLALALSAVRNVPLFAVGAAPSASRAPSPSRSASR